MKLLVEVPALVGNPETVVLFNSSVTVLRVAGSRTVTTQEALLVGSATEVAVIVAVPAATPVTTPFSTVAIVSAEVD